MVEIDEQEDLTAVRFSLTGVHPRFSLTGAEFLVLNICGSRQVFIKSSRSCHL